MKRFLATPTDASSSKKANKTSEFLVNIQNGRLQEAEGILDFQFKKKRVKILSKAEEVAENKNGIVYWMSRDMRVQDNWALLMAQKLALKNSLPLHVVFCLAENFLGATIRHYKFMLKGLEEISEECKDLDISFHLLRGHAGEQIPKFIEDFNIGALVVDFSPLRISRGWLSDVQEKLAKDIPLVQVDA